jgi:hypothetical protein
LTVVAAGVLQAARLAVSSVPRKVRRFMQVLLIVCWLYSVLALVLPALYKRKLLYNSNIALLTILIGCI